VKMVCDAKPTPGVLHCPRHECYILSRGLSFVRCLVDVQDEGWAVMCSLTNKTHKLNQDITRTQVYISLLPAYTSFLFSARGIHTDRILISTSHDLPKTMPLVPTHPITYTTLYFPSLSLWASFRYMQLYHNATVADVDSLSTHRDGTKRQQQRKGEGYGKDADISYRSIPVIRSGLYKGIHLGTHPWTHTDIHCLQRQGWEGLVPRV